MRNTKTRSSIALVVLSLAAAFQGSLGCFGQATTSQGATNVSLLESIRSAVENHPVLRSQQAQVEISLGAREQVSAQFDRLLQSSFNNGLETTPLTAGQQLANEQAGLLGTSQKVHAASLGISINRLFRNGIEFTAGTQTGRVVDNLFAASGINTSSTTLSLRVPLLRGRGRTATAGQEEAAKREVDATSLDLQQLVSQLMSNAATSYWSLVAARASLTIAIDAEQRGKVYLDNVRQLVKADRVPRNDLNEVTANLAQRSSGRQVAEQQLLAAQQQLALDMGINSDDILGQALVPSDPFPNGEGQPLPSDSRAAIHYYVEQGLRNRADYQASRIRATEQGVLLRASQNRLLPQLDLNASAGYAGLQEGLSVGRFYSDTVQGIRGPTAGIGLTYTFQHRNQAAHGAMLQAQGLSRQAQLQNIELERAISSQVVVSVGAVRSAIVRLKQADEAVNSFQVGLQGERDKYSGGIGSIIEILTVEDKLNSALAEQVQAQLNYALALVQFRFATGTLAKAGGSSQSVTADTFFTLPFLKSPEEN
jgi:outer membrane protein TolC